MSYTIGSGVWSSVFAVPSAVVDEHIKMCSPLSLKILLVMLRHPGTPVDAQWLSGKLNISPADISDALGYWVGAGIVQDAEAPVQHAEPAVQSASPAPVSSAPAPFVSESAGGQSGQRIITISARPKLGTDEIVALAASDQSVALLLREAQEILGAPLSAVESEILTALCGYYGMKTDAVLMLLQYCVSIGHKSMHYLEKLAAAWLEKGVSTHEQVEAEIVRLTRDNENEKKVIHAFGLYSRGLTPREREYVSQWFALGLEENMILLACERAAENTGKVSFAYADKIITSWKSRGISTVKAAVEDLNAAKKTAAAGTPKQNVSAHTGGDSSLDMDKLRDLLHQPNRD